MLVLTVSWMLVMVSVLVSCSMRGVLVILIVGLVGDIGKGLVLHLGTHVRLLLLVVLQRRLDAVYLRCSFG